jgi:hypothetical protein
VALRAEKNFPLNKVAYNGRLVRAMIGRRKAQYAHGRHAEAARQQKSALPAVTAQLMTESIVEFKIYESVHLQIAGSESSQLQLCMVSPCQHRQR